VKQPKSTSRLVSSKFPRESTEPRPRKVAVFNSRTPFEVEVPETDLSDLEERSRESREVSRLPSLERPSRNATRATGSRAALSSHPAALITPPTSIDDLPFLQNRRTADPLGGSAIVPAYGISDILANSTLPANAQRPSGAPMTGAARLDRVLNRTMVNNTSNAGGLSVPTLSQGPKLRSPFQPVGVGSAVPTAFSTTTEDTGASPEQQRVVAKPQGKVSATITSTHRATRTSPSLEPSEINGGMDEVEDSMHEDAVERASVRRKQSAAKRRNRASASSQIIGARSSSRTAPSSTTKNSQANPAVPRSVRESTAPVSRTAPTAFALPLPKSTPAQPLRQTRTAQPQSSSRSTRSASKGPASAPNIQTNVDDNPSSATQNIVDFESPQWPGFDVRALAEVREMSMVAIGEVNAERLEAGHDVRMEDAVSTGPEDNAIDFPPPPPDITPISPFEVYYPVGAAEQAQLDKVSKARNEKTLTWLKKQQEEAIRAGIIAPSDAASASASMSEGRRLDREVQDDESPELPHKKPDPKGKKRAAVSQEDRELLTSAGFNASDQHVERHDEDDEEAGESNAGPSTPAKSRTDRTTPKPSGRSPAPSQTARTIQPFAVVIRTGPSPVKGPSPQQRPAIVRAASSASQEIPTSAQRPRDPTPTPTPSQVIPTSAQQSKAATPAPSQVIPTSAQQSKATTRKSAIPKPTPSQEFFAFLPAEPSQSSPKRGRKRKDGPSSPIENLASELHAYSKPEQKKRKIESPKKAKTSQKTRSRSVPPPGSSLDDAIVVASDAEAQRPARSSSRSRRATTAVPTSSARSPSQRPTRSSANAAAGSDKPVSPSQSRLRSSSSRVPIILDGAADSEIESVEVRKIRPKAPKRPAAPTHRNSALLMGNKKRGIPQDDVMELDSGSDGAQPVDVDMQDAPADEEDATDNDLPEKADQPKSDSESTPRTSSLTGSQQLENDLQSSAHGNSVSETVPRLEVESARATVVPPPLMPSQSTQLSQPTQSSTMRSPESSPARSANFNHESSTPVVLPRQRSSSPDWLTPSHIRDRDEYRERVRQAAKSPSATPKKSSAVGATSGSGGSAIKPNAPVSAQSSQKQPLSLIRLQPQASPRTQLSKSPSQKLDDYSDADDSGSEDDEDDADEEDLANIRSKSREAMPPPQLPPHSASRAAITPVRGILKKTPSDSSLPATQHVRRVSIDPAASGGRSEVFTTTQRASTPSPNGVATRSSPRKKSDAVAEIPPAFLPLDANSAAKSALRQSSRLSASQPLPAQKKQESQSSVSASQPAPKSGKTSSSAAEQSRKKLIEEDEQESEENDDHSEDDDEEPKTGSDEDDEEHGHPSDVKRATRNGLTNALTNALSKAIPSSPPVNGPADSDEESASESEEEAQLVKQAPARMPANTNRAIPSASQPLPKSSAKTASNKPAPASSPIRKSALKQPASTNGAVDSDEESSSESEEEVQPVKKAPAKMPTKTNGKMPSASQPLPKTSTKPAPKKAAPASSPLRKPVAKQSTTKDSDDSSSSDDDDDGYSHASDDVDAIEAEMAQYLVSHPREKVGGLRSIIKCTSGLLFGSR